MIFYYFYRYFLYRNDESSKFGAVCGVFLIIGFHAILVFVVAQKLMGYNLLNSWSQSYYWNKALNMVVISPFLVLALLFFNKRRVDNIIQQYDNKENVFSIWNWAFFLILTLGVLLSIILLLKK